MKFSLCGASGVALLFGLGGAAAAQTVSTTQQTPVATTSTTTAAAPQTIAQPAQPTTQDKVTILGSLIATTPEDAAKPVEVITAQDLEDQGSPNIVEFLRSLSDVQNSDSGQDLGTTALGAVNNGLITLDIRGQGTSGTLPLINGRRVSTVNGGSPDVGSVPMEALEAVEVLKSGASATYGAGAVGGVINFRTRRDVNAPQVKLTKGIWDNGGRWEATLLNGWVGDAGNVLFNWTHTEEEALWARDRDFSSQPFAVNPNHWQTGSTSITQRVNKVTNWVPLPGTVATAPMTVGAATNDAQSLSDCAVFGGSLVRDLVPGSQQATNTGCAFNYADMNQLVAPSKQDRVYVEANTDITDNMEMHIDFTYSKYSSTSQRPPSDGVGTGVRVFDITPEPTIPGVANCGGVSCELIIPYRVPVWTRGTPSNATGTTTPVAPAPTTTYSINPFMADYNARMLAQGLPGSSQVGVNDALVTSSSWRPFFWGGLPLRNNSFAETTVQRERVVFNLGFKGQFAGDNLFSKALGGINYDVNGQYNQYTISYTDVGDYITERLQDAMMGYGGADCNAVDRVPTDRSTTAAYNRTIGIQSDTPAGTDGCKWLNPFMSNFESSFVTGAANPNYTFAGGSPTWNAPAGFTPTQSTTGRAGFINDLDLIDWMYGRVATEAFYQAATFDTTFSGTIPDNVFALPGGEIGWAAGMQWRLTERRGSYLEDDPEKHQIMLNRCPYGMDPPNAGGSNILQNRGCASSRGAFYSWSSGPIQPNPGNDPPDQTDSQTLAYYAEISLPVLDNVNLGASARREEFNGGAITGDIWSVSGKWDITPEIYLRGDYSTNFRAGSVLDERPGSIQTSYVAGANGTRLGAELNYSIDQLTDPNLGPEDDNTLNIGVGYQSRDFFGGRLRVSADYFRIIIDKDTTSTTSATVLNNVFYTAATNPTGARPNVTAVDNSLAMLADCSAALVPFITFTTGACQQGVTTGAQVDRVLTLLTNGSGKDTIGLNYNASYSYPMFDGYLTANLAWTEYRKYTAKPFYYTAPNGQQFLLAAGGDYLGQRNDGISGVSSNVKDKGSLSLRWANTEHNIGVRANLISGYNLNAAYGTTPIIDNTAASGIPDTFSDYGRNNKNYTDYDLTYIFTPKAFKDLQLSVSVLNVLDHDPPYFQNSRGFDPRRGNPRGRRVEFGFSKKF